MNWPDPLGTPQQHHVLWFLVLAPGAFAVSLWGGRLDALGGTLGRYGAGWAVQIQRCGLVLGVIAAVGALGALVGGAGQEARRAK